MFGAGCDLYIDDDDDDDDSRLTSKLSQNKPFKLRVLTNTNKQINLNRIWVG